LIAALDSKSAMGELVVWKYQNLYQENPASLPIRQFFLANTMISLHQNPHSPESGTADDPFALVGEILWDGGFLLSKYIEQEYSTIFHGKKIIELGSGTGLVGIVAALLGGDVTLTDYKDEVLELLQKNIRLNNLVHSNQLTTTQVKKLKWGDTTELSHIAWDYILAAEVVYGENTDPFRDLLNTLVSLSKFEKRSIGDNEDDLDYSICDHSSNCDRHREEQEGHHQGPPWNPVKRFHSHGY